MSYLPEVRKVLDFGDYPDVEAFGYPYDCLSSPFDSAKTSEWSAKCLLSGNDVTIIGGSCLKNQLTEQLKSGNLNMYQLEYCSELILSKELIEHFIQQRCYLVSNGWLIKYKQHIAAWGFDPDSAKKFFAESADKLLLIDTGITTDYQEQVDAISAYTGLPYEVLPIGLTHCRLLIDSLVFKWREKQERASLNERIITVTKKAADYAMIFEQMQRLVDLRNEPEIVNEIFNLLNLLFAPRTIVYHPVNEINKMDDLVYGELDQGGLLTGSNKLIIEARNQGEVLGEFCIQDLGFPEYLEQYNAMRRVIGGLGGLAIANARKFSTIQENQIQLKKSTAELQAANANKDKLFSIIAHDLRSPFSAFLGLTEIMSDDTEVMTIEELRRMAGAVQNSAKGLFSQLENLLEWSKLQMSGISYNPVITNLGILADEELELIQAAANKKQIDLVKDFPEFLEVYSDHDMIRSIIRNLLANAVKFSRLNGKVRLSASVLTNKDIEISVIDEGIGMSEEILGNLFSLQHQTNRKGTSGEPSAGLGLLICKEMVERLGGKLQVSSVEEAGSIFKFTVPDKKKESDE